MRNYTLNLSQSKSGFLLVPPAVIQMPPDHCCISQLCSHNPYVDNLPMEMTDVLDDNNSSCVSPFEDRSIYHQAVTFNQLPENLLVTVQGYNLFCQERHLLVYFDVQETDTPVKTRQCGLHTVSGDLKSPQNGCGFICHLTGVTELPVVIHTVLRTYGWDSPILKKAKLCEITCSVIAISSLRDCWMI